MSARSADRYLFPVLQAEAAQPLEQGAHGRGRDDEVMDFAGRVVVLLLDDAGDRTGRAADADEGQLRVLQPAVAVDFGGQQVIDIAPDTVGHGAAEVEHGRRVDGAHGDRHGINQLAVPEQDEFRRAAAQVEQNAFLHVQGVDGAQKAQVGFGRAGQDMQVDARLFRDLLDQLRAVRRIADGRRGDGDDLVGLVLPAHEGEGLHGRQGQCEGRVVQPAFLCQALRKAQRLLLVEDHVIRAVAVDLADDQARRVRAYVDDGDSLHNFLLRACRAASGAVPNSVPVSL